MLIRMLAVASLVVAAACAADDPSDGDPSQSNDVQNPNVADQPPEGSTVPAEGLVLNTRRTECASDGPCSPACATNDEVIDIHVPNGQCVTFDCTAEGAGIDVGGCHP